MASGNITTPKNTFNSCTIDNLIPVTNASIISIFWQHHSTFYTTTLATNELRVLYHLAISPSLAGGSEVVPIFPENKLPYPMLFVLLPGNF